MGIDIKSNRPATVEDYVTQELSRLRAIEREYNAMVQVVKTVSHLDPEGTRITFTVSIADVNNPKLTWIEVVERAMQKVLNESKGH